MRVTVSFYSWFKDLTGCANLTETVADGATIGDLLETLRARFPKFAAMRRSMLMSVDVEYQTATYVLKEGDEVSFFPPVQGG
jgi:molybdopterin converting factor small subunit